MHRYLGALSMDVICACAYGIKINSIANPDHPIVVNIEKLLCFDTNFSVLTSILFPRLAKWLRLNFFDIQAINNLDQIINHVKIKRRKNIAEFENDSGQNNLVRCFFKEPIYKFFSTKVDSLLLNFFKNSEIENRFHSTPIGL